MVIKRILSLLQRNRGQELVEYAITLPLFFFLAVGIFDLGRVVYFASAVQNAAREGARYGVAHAWDTANVIDRVKERALGVGAGDLTVSVDWDPVNCELVTVHVDFEFDPITPLVDNFFPGGNPTISVESELQRERWKAKPGEPDAGCAPFTIPPAPTPTP